MSLQLTSLKFLARGQQGWSSGLLSFGKHITLIKGPNGAGKTPLILGAAYCLGYPAVFRQDVKDRCSAVELTVQSGEAEYRIHRPLNGGTGWISIQTGTNETVAFDSELTFATWLFQTAGIPRPKLTRTDGSSAVEVYLSTFLPCFYIDQNKGWQTLYSPPAKFIDDQHQEMLRLVLGLPARHPFAAKDQLIAERQALLRIEESLAHRLAVIRELEPEAGADRDATKESLGLRREKVQKRLHELKSGVNAVTNSTSAFDSKIADIRAEVDRRLRMQADADARVRSSQTIAAEIKSEIEALSLNVEAADRFRRFCGLETCRLFAPSEEAYGKSLLYLKDQQKDLESNGKSLTEFSSRIAEEVILLVSELEKIEGLRTSLLSERGFDSLIAMVEAASKELVEIETDLVLRTRIDEQRLKLAALLERKEATKLRIQELEDTSRVSSGTLVTTRRCDLGDAVTRWLKVLHTPNLRGPAAFDDRFVMTIGGEKLSAFSGSTLTRIVLAYHAAVSEVALGCGGNHLGFLILDTPMQQELKVTDLQDYILNLRVLAKKYSGRLQICLSFSDANIAIQADDTVWSPAYTFGKDQMFLGPS